MLGRLVLVAVALVGVALVSIDVPHASAATSTHTFTPVADALVHAGYPNRNYGTARTLRVDRSPRVTSYLRFNVTGLSGTVAKATLHILPLAEQRRRIVVRPVASNRWRERTIAYGNAPRMGPETAMSGRVRKGTRLALDVTRVVRRDGSISFGLTTAGSGVSAASREQGSVRAPRLVVTTADTTAPTISISSPASGATYTSAQTVAISAAASDDSGVAKVEFYDNGVWKGTEDTSPFTYAWSVTSADNGTHGWTAKAYDAAGNSATSAAIDLTVDIASSTSPTPSPGPITATVETDPVPNAGDAADDPAVWIHPSDTSKSTIIGTDKLGGLAVYDLSGKQLHYYSGILPNNVDIRYRFSLGGQATTLVTASERATKAIVVYRVNASTRGLENVAARPLSLGMGAAGLCMYRSAKTGKYYVFVGDESGNFQQWELFESAGQVDAKKVRTISFGSTTEGCVADDELGHLYVAEEDVAIWRYGAEPETGTTRLKVDAVAPEGHITADIEGLSIYYAREGKGYLLASSQGSNDFVLYERQAPNAYVTRFQVAAGTIDRVSYTDGIDVTNFPLGTAFPEGAFLAQDDRNDSGNQNFKLVPWGTIARSLGLTIDTSWDPRTGGATSDPATSPPPPPPAPATTGMTYYVDSVGGSDSNSGTSESAPWKGVAKANAAPLVAGDRLLFKRGGSWSGTKLTISKSGTSTSPIVVGAYGAGALPVVTGASTCVELTGSHVVLRELNAHDCSWAGIAIAGSANWVEASLVTRNAAGISVKSGAVGNLIVGNTLRDNNKMSVLTASPTDDDSGAFGILLHGDETEIAYNTISGSDAFSYDYGRDGAAVEVYGGQRNHIHHNLVVDNDAFTELGNSRSADNTYAYNVVRSSLPESGFLTTRGSGSSYGPVLRTRAYSNTVYMTGTSSQGFVCHAGCGSDILTMRNNLIQAVLKTGYADAPFDENYNLYYGGKSQFQLGANSIVADPSFVDRAAGNLRLQAGSPAVDRGVGGLAYAHDFDGLSAPFDGDADGVARVDMGAYEYRR